MRRSLVDDDDGGSERCGPNRNRIDRTCKRSGRSKARSKRLAIRSNSISAFSSRREASISATTNLSFLYRLSVEETVPPIMDQLIQSPKFRIRSPSLQSVGNPLLSLQPLDYQSPLVDLPTKFVRIHGTGSWTFDIFSFKRRSSSQLVCSLGLHLFEQHDLMRKLCLDYVAVSEALGAIESVYWQHNPYHTALHAADVTQAIHCFISQPKLYKLLSPAEVLGSLLAALCHDADHPGMNQLHLERTGNFLVPLYNASSVLEQHHARVGLTILHRSGLARCLNKATWATVRECMIKLIQATDMAHQGLYKTKFSNLVDAKKNSPKPVYTQADRILLLQMSLKCADISNPCRPWQLCRQWAHRICAEFFCQGDHERNRWSLTPAKCNDRTGSSVPAIQVGFIENLIKPLFASWHEFFQTDLTQELMTHLDANLTSWSRMLTKGNLKEPENPNVEAVPAPAPGASEGDCSRRKNPACTRTKVERKTRKVFKTRGCVGRKKTDSKTCGHQVTFALNCEESPKTTTTTAPTAKVVSVSGTPSAFELANEHELSGLSGLHTFLITTTQGLRRHSLPETQGAIRKTFDFTLSKRSQPMLVLDTRSGKLIRTGGSGGGGHHDRTVRSSGNTAPVNSVNVLPTTAPPTGTLGLCSPTARPCHKSLRTASANILQTLCEELMHNQKPLDCQSAVNPFPLPDAWNKFDRAGACQPSLAINLAATDFVTLAHRRSSVPLIEK